MLSPSITIGFPTLPQATEGERAVIVGVLAPVGEELLFRGFVLNAALMIIPSAIIMVPAQAVIFAIFHSAAYAGSFSLQSVASVSGALIGAGVFGVVAGFLILWRKSLLTPMIVHSMFNLYLVGKYLVVVSL
jgi:membrane protease YdiL (CAAX protease family)